MDVNDAHLHFGWNGYFGSRWRRLSIAKNNHNSLTKDWDKYRIQNAVLFSVPEPAGYLRYYSELVLLKLEYFAFRKHILRKPIDDSLLANNNYSKINDEINKINDSRIEFVPFVNSKFEISDIERFDNIKGVKFYEPYGAIPESLLDYLNENELNIVLHLSDDREKNPDKFLEIVEDNDGIKFQVAHCANGIPEIINALGEYSNLFVDTAACTHWQYKQIPLESIAQEHTDKVVFGSDGPWTKYDKQIAQILGLDLSKNEKEKILNKNYFQIWK